MICPLARAGIFLAYTLSVNCLKYIRIAATTIGVITLASLARADKTDFRVNTDGAAVEHSQPRVAVIPGKGFAIVWSDYRSGDRSIYIQRFKLNGDPVGTNTLVNTDTLGVYQAGPAVGIDGSGHYEVVWQDYRDGTYPFGPHVYFQRFDSSLTLLGTNRNLTVEKPDSLKELPDIDIDSWGRGVVVWADYRNHNWDIYGQIISSTGALVGSNFKINDDNSLAQQHSPRVSMSSDGWFIVTWYDNRLGNDDIFVQRFDTLGTPIGHNTRVNSDVGSARQAFPDIATDGAGRFTVIWVDWRNGTYPANPDIYARRFDTLLNALTIDTRISNDGSNLAQRDPAIASDRNGNVAMVWSDSGSSSWDVAGQMIDAGGMVREVNFRANTRIDSAQLQPGVALDGRNRYVTWVDKRNGQFDIYASIVTYNNPTLLTSPSQLQFSVDISDTILPAQNLIVNHAGYNPIHFRAKSSIAWLNINPASGLTSDTISVALSQKLVYGTHYAAINLVDDDNRDSSLTVPVRVDVTAPILSVTPDTILVAAFAGLQDTVHTVLSIQNLGSGQINWSATSTASWLKPSPPSGTAPANLDLPVVSVGLDTGQNTGEILIAAPDIAGSPDTITVILSVVANRPFLRVTPDSVHISVSDTILTGLPTLHVTNAGTESINWTGTAEASWVILDRSAGVAGDSIGLSFDWSLLAPGRSATHVRITDSSAFNVSVDVPVIVDWLTGSSDTLVMGTASGASGDTVSIPLEADLIETASEVSLPITFPDSLLQFDSVSVDGSLGSVAVASGVVGSVPGTATVHYATKAAADSIHSGKLLLGRIHFTSKSVAGVAEIAEYTANSTSSEILTSSGQRVRPTVLPGQITIGTPTGVLDEGPTSLPKVLTLVQNYPNPFNSSTVIRFGLPAAGGVKLELFNILGQRVVQLLDQTLSAGWHQIAWQGKYDNGLDVPSGIYFYRLETGHNTQVRKLIVLK